MTFGLRILVFRLGGWAYGPALAWLALGTAWSHDEGGKPRLDLQRIEVQGHVDGEFWSKVLADVAEGVA
jgi:hypothetical protein